jgi:hypothetical protein
MGRLAMAYAARNRTAYFHVADIAQALADGTLKAGEAAALGKFVHCFSRTLTNCDLEARVALVELKLK